MLEADARVAVMTTEEMVAQLAIVEDYFEARADVNWEGDGPNEAMRCQQAIEAVMTALRQPDVFTRALSLLTKTLGEKEATIEALRAVLREVEWSARDASCPCCGKLWREDDTTHKRGCALAAVLAGTEERP